MNHEEFYGTVDFSISAGLVPWGDPGEYVHTVTGKALDLNEDEVGTISLKFVSATEAENRGERLLDVCDADSAILEAVYATLFDTNGETKDDLDIEPVWNNLLFIEAVEIKPGFEESSLRVQLIETAIAMFCSEGLVVAVEHSLDLTIDEWRQLGFRRIAGNEKGDRRIYFVPSTLFHLLLRAPAISQCRFQAKSPGRSYHPLFVAVWAPAVGGTPDRGEQRWGSKGDSHQKRATLARQEDQRAMPFA